MNSRTGFTPSRQRPIQPDQQQGDVDECWFCFVAADLLHVQLRWGRVATSATSATSGAWSGAPCVYWLVAGADAAAFAAVRSVEDMMAAVAEQPSNHSPFFGAVVEPTRAVGIGASGGGGSDAACGVVT